MRTTEPPNQRTAHNTTIDMSNFTPVERVFIEYKLILENENIRGDMSTTTTCAAIQGIVSYVDVQI